MSLASAPSEGGHDADPDAPGGRSLTAIGRKLARLPLDPRLARMVLAAEEEGCVHEVMVVAAAEVVVGLALILAIMRRRQGATADDLTTAECLRGL